MSNLAKAMIPLITASLLVLLSCNLPGAGPTADPPGGEAGVEVAEGVVTERVEEGEAATNTPRPTDGDGVLLVFNPHPYTPNVGRGELGSVDYMELFEPDAQWMEAASRVDVLQIYGGWVAREATIDELRQVVEFAEAHGMALSFEAGPLQPIQYCKDGTPPEGFAGTREGRVIARRIQEAGGTFDYYTMDEPLSFAHLDSGPIGCGWPQEKVAAELGAYIDYMRSEFPGIVIGDNEPLWAGTEVQAYKDWIRTYEEVIGEPMGFFNLDMQWSRTTWPQDAREIERYADSQGVPFGIIYFGDEDADTDAEWLDAAEERMVTFESLMGGTPERVLLQSWHVHPNAVLPETKRDTFTNLINRYFRTRTVLQGESPLGDGGTGVSGSLRTASGEPRPATSIEFEILPTSGEGIVGEYTVRGEVPPGAVEANVGARVNLECGCSSPVRLSLYGAEYREEGGGNLIPNARFANGSWGHHGSAAARLVASDVGGGRRLLIEAEEGEGLIVNGGRFAVEAGASYELTFEARVAPESVGGGYLALFFLGPVGEIQREQVPLAPAPAAEGSIETDGEGGFDIEAADLPVGAYQVSLLAEGDEEYWPAATELPLKVGDQ